MQIVLEMDEPDTWQMSSDIFMKNEQLGEMLCRNDYFHMVFSLNFENGKFTGLFYYYAGYPASYGAGRQI